MSDRIHRYESGGARWEDEFDFDEDVSGELPPRRRRPWKPEVLHEEERFLVVAKPAGLPTITKRFDKEHPTVVSELQRVRGGAAPIPCHRLDEDTSGCLLLALDREAARTLMTAFRKREVRKTYLALVTGAPYPERGELEYRIDVDRRRPGAMRLVNKGGKVGGSTYETLEVFRGITLVRVTPVTGRTHEVRLALKSLGTPCAVDPLYGSPDPLLLSQWKRNYKLGRGRVERPLVDRLTLHAETLSFPHPEADEGEDRRVEVEAPLPKDLAATLRQLRRFGAPGTL